MHPCIQTTRKNKPQVTVALPPPSKPHEKNVFIRNSEWHILYFSLTLQPLNFKYQLLNDSMYLWFRQLFRKGEYTMYKKRAGELYEH